MGAAGGTKRVTWQVTGTAANPLGWQLTDDPVRESVLAAGQGP